MNGLRPVLDNLVLCLDFMNPKTTVGIGVICSDLSGNKNDVTLFNGATYSNSKEIVFDGVNDYIACGNIIAGRTQFSAEVWVKTIDTRTGSNGTYHNPSMFGTQHGAGTSGDFAMCVKNGNLGFYHELNGSSGYVDTNIYISDGTWKHIVITKSTAGVIMIYLNGVVIYNGSGYTTTMRSINLVNYDWELGRAYWNDVNMLCFNGSIGIHRLYSSVLSLDDVSF